MAGKVAHTGVLVQGCWSLRDQQSTTARSLTSVAERPTPLAARTGSAPYRAVRQHNKKATTTLAERHDERDAR